MDGLDLRLLVCLEEDPRVTVQDLSVRLGAARNTVHHRLARLQAAGLLRQVRDQAALTQIGYEISAFVTVEVAQGRLLDVAKGLAALPQVLEAHATTGRGDLLCRVVATGTRALHELVQAMLQVPGVLHTTTSVSVEEVIPYRARPLLEAAAERLG